MTASELAALRAQARSTDAVVLHPSTVQAILDHVRETGRRCEAAEVRCIVLRDAVADTHEALDGADAPGTAADDPLWRVAELGDRYDEARHARAVAERDLVAVRAELATLTAEVGRLRARRAAICTRCHAGSDVYDCGGCLGTGAVVVEGAP